MATFKLHLICRWSAEDFELYREGLDESDVESAWGNYADSSKFCSLIPECAWNIDTQFMNIQGTRKLLPKLIENRLELAVILSFRFCLIGWWYFLCAEFLFVVMSYIYILVMLLPKQKFWESEIQLSVLKCVELVEKVTNNPVPQEELDRKKQNEMHRMTSSDLGFTYMGFLRVTDYWILRSFLRICISLWVSKDLVFF